MARKPVARLMDEDPPEYQCATCWFYEPIELEHGGCYGIPPHPFVDGDGDMSFPRSIVLAEDRGCALWKPRHKA